MNNKEKNFVSAVFYLHNDAERVVPFVSVLSGKINTVYDLDEVLDHAE